MPADLMDSDILDLSKSTLKDLGKNRFTSIAEELVDYPVLSKILRKEKMQFEGGNGIQRTIVTDDSGVARDVPLHSTDNVQSVDVLAQLDIPWKQTETHFVYERREILRNLGAGKIVDLMKVKRYASMLSLAKHMENVFWGKPANSDDKLKIFGLFYWAVYNATAGHTGADPSGFTAGAGNVSSSTYDRWKNYAFQYAKIKQNDALRKMRTATRKTGFKSPMNYASYMRNGGRFSWYCNDDSFNEFEEVGISQNENLGRDVAWIMNGEMTFKRNPINYVQTLDNKATSAPLVGIDWSVFYPVFLKGDYLHEGEPKVHPTKHNTFIVWTDLSWNILCTDRRKLILGAKSDPATDV